MAFYGLLITTIVYLAMETHADYVKDIQVSSSLSRHKIASTLDFRSQCATCTDCLLPLALDCTSFIYCVNGIGTLQKCGEGTLFNPQIENCDLPENVKCNDEERSKEGIALKCPKPKGLFAHPHSCENFIHCSHGIGYVKSCPAGLQFSSKTERCEWPHLAECNTGLKYTSPVFPEKRNLSVQCSCKDCYIPNEMDCRKYYLCKQGIAYERECSSGLEFNESTRLCTRSHNRNCTKEKVTTPKTFKFECPSQDGLFSNPMDCGTFYQCVQGTAYLKSCPQNLHFSRFLLYCDHPHSASCKSGMLNPKAVQSSKLTNMAVKGTKTEPNMTLQRTLSIGLSKEGIVNSSIAPVVNTKYSKTSEIRSKRNVAFSCDCTNCLMPHPNDCTRYLECINSKPEARKCPPNYVFNPTKRKCERNTHNRPCSNNQLDQVLPLQPSRPTSSTGIDIKCSCSHCNLPYPSDCSKYIECINYVPNERKCPSTYAFNPQKGKCEKGYIDKDCHKPVEPKNQLKPSGISFQCSCSNCLLPHPESCTKYFDCSDGLPTERQCPKGYVFSNIKNKCEKGEGCKILPQPTLKPFDVHCPCHSCLIPDKENCASYVECLGGIPHKRKCPPGYIFSVKKNACEKDSGNNCLQNIGTTREPINKEVINHCPCTACILPNPNSCNEYTECIGRLPQPRVCPANYVFNTEKKRCEWNNGNNCVTNIVGKEPLKCPYSDGMFRYVKDCRKFIRCKNGLSSLEECPANLHFSVIRQQCTLPSSADCDGTGDQNIRCSCNNCLLKNPADCTSYFECTSGYPLLRHCPKHYAFSEVKGKCERSDGIKCPRLVKDPLCPQASGLFPHPVECQKYVTCANGKSTIKSCPKGQHFNKATGYCDSPHNARCTSIEEEPMPFRPVLIGEDVTCPCPSCILRDPSDCTAYFECFNLRPLRRRCPPTYTFDKDKRACLKTRTQECQGIADENMCPAPNGTFPFPEDCEKFIHCSNGIPSLKACAANYHYSKTNRRCEPPEVAKCSVSTIIDSVKCPCRHCLIPDAADCTTYLECMHGMPHRRHCPPNYAFDRNIRKCVWHKNSTLCPGLLDQSLCLRPYGLFPHPSDCHKFVHCSNGLPYIKSCPGGLHFSDTQQMCMKPEEAECDRRATKEVTNGPINVITETTKTNPQEIITSPAHTEPHLNKITTTPKDPNILRPRINITTTPRPQDDKINTITTTFKPHENEITSTVTTVTTPKPNDPQCSCINCVVADHSDPSSFYQCIDGMAKKLQCPEGSIFNSSQEKCIASNKWIDTTIVEPAFCATPTGLFPFPGDCRKFVHCDHGIPYVKDCPANLEFDPDLKVCVWPNGQCVISGHHDSDPRCLEPSGLFPHPTTCNFFYHCDHGTAFLKVCPGNLHFNRKLKVCDWPQNVNCQDGVLKQSSTCEAGKDIVCPPCNCRIPNPDSFNSFYECQNGVPCKKTCPTGLKFNRRTFTCDIP